MAMLEQAILVREMLGKDFSFLFFVYGVIGWGFCFGRVLGSFCLEVVVVLLLDFESKRGEFFLRGGKGRVSFGNFFQNLF